MNPTDEAPTTTIQLRDVVPSRWQPRRTFNPDSLLELAASIRDFGVLVPILAFRNEDQELELIAGERRVRARTAVALATQIPAWIAVHGDDLAKAVNHIARHGWLNLAKVVVYADGDRWHQNSDEIGPRADRDADLDNWLQGRGWTVVRLPEATITAGDGHLKRELAQALLATGSATQGEKNDVEALAF